MANRVKYQYQVIRYRHDQVTGEFVNVGVVLYSESHKFFKCKVISKYARISNFFNHRSDYAPVIKTLKYIESTLNKLGDNMNDIFSSEFEKSISDITSKILPSRDNSLYFSELFSAIDYNLEGAFNELYNRLVSLYIPDEHQQINTDNATWARYYKTYFDSYGISARLKPHKVKTNHDEFLFDKAWKNGTWHCFQALSLSLKREDSIRNKIYKWSGILDNLENATEPIHLYFLTSSVGKNKNLRTFIDNNITRHENSKLKITLVTEQEAEKIAKTVQKEIIEHEDNK